MQKPQDLTRSQVLLARQATEDCGCVPGRKDERDWGHQQGRELGKDSGPREGLPQMPCLVWAELGIPHVDQTILYHDGAQILLQVFTFLLISPNN